MALGSQTTDTGGGLAATRSFKPQSDGTTPSLSTAAPTSMSTAGTTPPSFNPSSAPTGTMPGGGFGFNPQGAGTLGGYLGQAMGGNQITSSWRDPTPVYSDSQIQQQQNQTMADAATKVASDRRATGGNGIASFSPGKQYSGAVQAMGDWAAGANTAQQQKLNDITANQNSLFNQQAGRLEDMLGQLGVSQDAYQAGQQYQNENQQALLQAMLGQGNAIGANQQQNIQYGSGMGNVGLKMQDLMNQNQNSLANYNLERQQTYNNTLNSALGF